MRVTIPLEGREPFAAECGEDRWVEIPKGTKPAEPAFSECDADFRCERERYSLERSPCRVWPNGAYFDASRQFRIRPTNDRSWSDIGLADEPAQAPVWTTVYAPVPRDQVEEVQFECGGVWSPSAVEDGRDWASALLAAGYYRVRYKPGFPKPEGAAPPFPPIGTAQVKAPAQDAFADPRISALEAENAALRWALTAMRVEFVSSRSCFLMRFGSIESVQAEAADIPHFVAARAAMERKP